MEADNKWNDFCVYLKNSILNLSDKKEPIFFQICSATVQNKELFVSLGNDSAERFYSQVVTLLANQIVETEDNFADNDVLIKSVCEVIVLFCLKHLANNSTHLLVTELQLIQIIESLCKGKSTLNNDVITNIQAEDLAIPGTIENSIQVETKNLFLEFSLLKRPDKNARTNYVIDILRRENAVDVIFNCILNFKEFFDMNEKYDIMFDETAELSRIEPESILTLENQLGIIKEIVELPIIEPLSNKQLDVLLMLVEMSLKAALFVASGCFVVDKEKVQGSDMLMENYCRKHGWKSTEHSLAIVASVSELFIASPRIEKFVAQNMETRSVCTILSGLKNAISHQSQDKKWKWFDGLNIMLVTMTPRVILLLSSLIDNLQLEGKQSLLEEGKSLSVLTKSSAWDRLNYMMDKLSLSSFLLDLFIAAYSKGIELSKLLEAEKQDELDLKNDSDEDSSLEEGSMLGSFFVEPTPELDNKPAASDSKEKNDAYAQSSEIFLLLSSSLLEFVGKFFPICVENGFKEEVKASLTEKKMDVLVKVTLCGEKDQTNDQKEITEHVGKLFCYLITKNLLPQQEVNDLLVKLGVPVSMDVKQNLNLNKHVITIFLQLALTCLKSHSEDGYDSVITAWKVLLRALVEASSVNTTESLNLLFAKVMLLLHQMLPSSQKTIVLNECVNTIHAMETVSITSYTHSNHITAIFEYMLFNCYTGPDQELLKSVQSMLRDPVEVNYIEGKDDTFTLVKESKTPDAFVLETLKSHTNYQQWYSSYMKFMVKLLSAANMTDKESRKHTSNAVCRLWDMLKHLPIPISWLRRINKPDIAVMGFEDYLFFLHWAPFTYEMSFEEMKRDLSIVECNDDVNNIDQFTPITPTPSAVIKYIQWLTTMASNLFSSQLLPFSPFMVCDAYMAFSWLLLKKYVLQQKENSKTCGGELGELIHSVIMLLKSAVLKSKELVISLSFPGTELTAAKREFYMDVIGVDLPEANSRSYECEKFQVLPDALTLALKTWNDLKIKLNGEFIPILFAGLELKTDEINTHITTVLSFTVRDILKSHIHSNQDALSSHSDLGSLKKFIQTLSDICEETLPWLKAEAESEFQKIQPFSMATFSWFWLDQLLSHTCHHSETLTLLCLDEPGRDNLEIVVFIRILEIIDKWLTKEFESSCSLVEEATMIGWLKFLANLMQNKQTLMIFLHYFQKQPACLYRIFKSIASDKSYSEDFGNAYARFFMQLASLKDQPHDSAAICSLLKIFQEDEATLNLWLLRILFTVKDGTALLRLFVNLAIKNSHSLEICFSAILNMCSFATDQIFSDDAKKCAFPAAFTVALEIATFIGSNGHMTLLTRVESWLEKFQSYGFTSDDLTNDVVCGGLQEGPALNSCEALSQVIYTPLREDRKINSEVIECMHTVVSYVGKVISSLSDEEKDGSEYVQTVTNVVEEDSAADESDDEPMVRKVCTFSVTQRDFMNQHWYHCHTCKMNDGVGCCTVCAKICHKDHDVTYAKHGSFFCDCGAKDDGSCKAINPSSSSHGSLPLKDSPKFAAWSSSAMLSLSKTPATTIKQVKVLSSLSSDDLTALRNILKNCQEEVYKILREGSVFYSVFKLLLVANNVFIAETNESGDQLKKQKHNLKKHLELVYNAEKEYSIETMMNAISGSQEGAFENIKLSYSGEQGATLRQLINTHSIHHKAMCLIVSPRGKRQYLAVAHEKGKVTILQLAGLLRLPESHQKKMTLNRLSSTTLPFTVLHMVSNPLNDDYLAVTGVKDCQVLILGNSATVLNRIVVNQKLETGNYIIKAVWLPGSQTQLAISTADFVKIFDLSSSNSVPIHHFVVPSGKVRDATFITEGNQTYIVLMSSQGYIYTEILNEASGSDVFYMMHILDVQHYSMEETAAGMINGGGASVYYSQMLKLFFFSYSKGKSFAASLEKSTMSIKNLFYINTSLTSTHALFQWNEVPGQLGLLYATQQNTGNIVVLAIKPEKIIVQEIRSASKSLKVLSSVCYHYTSVGTKTGSVSERTTLINLMDDGSLRIYNANHDLVQFLKPPGTGMKSAQFTQPDGTLKQTTKSNGKTKIPVDFFESCQVTEEVEFGGADILRIYNKVQVKNRLDANGMYIANTKPSGFKVEVVNTNTSNVLVGVRIQIGVQSMDRSPQYVEIHGRIIQMKSAKNRWFDIPFSREESIACNEKNKFVITFGPSSDPYGVSFVDSIKVYVKTKESFGVVAEPTKQPPKTEPSTFPIVEKHEDSPTEILLATMLTTINQLATILDSSYFQLAFDVLLAVSSNLLTLDPQLLGSVSVIGCQTHLLLKNLFSGEGKYQNKKDEILVSHLMRTFNNIDSSNDMDCYELVLNIAESVGAAHAENLVKNIEISSGEKCDKFAVSLVKRFWKIHSLYFNDNNGSSPDSLHINKMVEHLVEILFSIMLGDAEQINEMAQLIMDLLLVKDQTVSFAAKKGLIKSLHSRQKHPLLMVTIQDFDENMLDAQEITDMPSKPIATTTPVEEPTEEDEMNIEEEPQDVDEMMEEADMVIDVDDEEYDDIEDGDLQMLLDDDSAMMEIALALSLQNDDEGGTARTKTNDEFSQDGWVTPTDGNPDDEEAEENDGNQDITVTEDIAPDDVSDTGRQDSVSVSPDFIEGPSLLGSENPDLVFSTLWTKLLGLFEEKIPTLMELDGLQAIPFLQVLLMLCSNLMDSEDDKAMLRRIITACVKPLQLKNTDTSTVPTRSASSEVQLVLMRFLSVLMSRCSANKQSGDEDKQSSQSSNFDAYVASTLLDLGLVDYCLALLKGLLPYWQTTKVNEEDTAGETTSLLKIKPLSPTPDMMPFFMEQYVKSHAVDLFEAFPQLVSEMMLRMPYQIHKLQEGSVGETCFSKDWTFILCEYMLIPHTPFIRRQVRKLLLALCGSKEKYRFVKDLHNLRSHLTRLREVLHLAGITVEESLPKNISLSYEDTVALTEQISACIDVATSRNENWQSFCKKEKAILPFLMEASYQLDEHISSKLIELISMAVCSKKNKQEKKEKNKNLCVDLIKHLFARCSGPVLLLFMKSFLLESNSTHLRWEVHDLIHSMFSSVLVEQQIHLVDLMWSLWSLIPSCGHRASQFIDLLGFFTISTSKHIKLDTYTSTVMSLLHEANEVLMKHPNASIYRKLHSYVELEGFYLESDPCPVCNNPEVTFNNYKLASIKSDIRYTPKSQLIKLTTNYTISKLSLKISDLKRAKMVKTMNIFYNNKPIPSVIGLKKSGIWQKAKKIFLTQNQVEVKVEFPFPITACNLMFEFASFYDNTQFSTESLQCPRCSATVPAHPGVCGNCGENVYQCHKCRAINYDERDPFLCTSCGFCKYAKFEFTLSAHPRCTVEVIVTEENRQKALKAVNNTLDKADQHYQALTSHRQALEVYLKSSNGDDPSTDCCIYNGKDNVVWNVSALTSTTQSTASLSSIKQSIQGVAQLYCVDCKSTFDDMSKTTQTVTALRKELVQYDIKQKEILSQAVYTTPDIVSSPASFHDQSSFARLPSFSAFTEESFVLDRDEHLILGKCYGCALSTVHHCLTVLRALSTVESTHDYLLKKGLLEQLVKDNLQQQKKEIVLLARTLLIKLTSENREANKALNEIICKRVCLCLSTQTANMTSELSLSNELSVLKQSILLGDALWEQRLQCVFKLFLDSLHHSSAKVLEVVTLPCLDIINSCVKSKPSNKKVIPVNKPSPQLPPASMRDWLDGKTSYVQWNQHKDTSQPLKAGVLETISNGWIKPLLFAPSSRATRVSVCGILENIVQNTERKEALLHLLASYLDQLQTSGENADEYLSLFNNLLNGEKVYMCRYGILESICILVSKEVEHLTALEKSTLNVDLAQGYSLFALAELLKSFLEDSEVKVLYQGKFVAEVLQCYLSLRKLVVQRTKLVDLSQDILLSLLGQLTSGTEEKSFMKTCIDVLKRCPLNDFRTPVFIFEQLCSTIYKEEEETLEFFMSLDKDPQQEDFLQGRMHGNPYSSNEPGLGPLMRDVKNKICTECELVALLEDDTGMELLVNNKIISLDLPVDQVYKKIWCSKDDYKDAMKIVYRMRGLLGDATEDMVENLNSDKEEDVDEESEYQRASIMVEIGGLEVVLKRLSYVRDLSQTQHLVAVTLKLLEYCIKVKVNRQYLGQPSVCGMKILLALLNLALRLERDQGCQSGGAMIAERVLKIMEVVLHEATTQGDVKQVDIPGEESQLELLLMHITSPYVRSNSSVLQAMMRLTPFLTFGSEDTMMTLVEHFLTFLDFDRFDNEKDAGVALHLDCFCMIADGIPKSDSGFKLKDLLLREGIVAKALEYLQSHTPPQSFRASGFLDSAKWKELMGKPSLPYLLRLLTGLLNNHRPTQLLIASDENVALIHNLEQISSEEMVGSLAENLMEALRTFPEGESKVAEVRRKTRDEKKALAMAMRAKQLESLGMTETVSGQIKAKSPSASKEMVQLLKEKDQRIVCCICREGYKFYPNKVLGIYIYTSRCLLDESENKPKKTQGYSTVSHFNIIHFDCHIEAVRHARSRDEWESAALQNANTKCNGLLPLWGPKVSESAFASCLARHNSYLQECTGFREPTFHSSVHDIKLMFLRFALQKSFSQDAGGGGKYSNLYLIPYLVQVALYVVNTTRQRVSEEQWLKAFMDADVSTWIASCYEVNGPLFSTVLSIFVSPLNVWKSKRLYFLKRLLLLAHVRSVSNVPMNKLASYEPKAFSVYKPTLVFFSLVDQLHLLSKCKIDEEGEWFQAMATYLRNNDEAILKDCDVLLKTYEDDLLTSESFGEFCDVAGILSEVGDADAFLRDVLKQFTDGGEVFC